MDIYRIPILSDNYIFLWHDPISGQAAVVDPGRHQPVLKMLERLRADLVAIFNTHHHWDHVDGNRPLLSRFPNLSVYGGVHDQGRIPGQTHFLAEGDRITFAEWNAEVLFIPGHTSGHIAYYFAPQPAHPKGELFCGDTLFAAGCGRLLGGTPIQMLTSLNRLKRLPPATNVWCTHEYTLSNLKFAITVDGENSRLLERYASVKKLRSQGVPTIPTTLDLENKTNPFLRCDQAELMKRTQSQDSLESFTRLRAMKDRF